MKHRALRRFPAERIRGRKQIGGAGIAVAVFVTLVLGFANGAGGGATAGVAATATGPTSCHPTVERVRRKVAPGLTLLKVSRTYGTCRQAIRVNARGPGNILWANDSTNGLWRSVDDARTWRLVYRATGYLTVDDVLRLRSGHLLIIVQRRDGRRFILRSLDRVGRRFSRPVFAFPFNPAVHSLHDAPGLLSVQSWLQLGNTIYVGEYGSKIKPVYLWKSRDDGRSFTVATSFTGVRHIHSLYADPYVRGRLWATIGDSGAEPRIGYSSNGGTTFTWITRGTYPESRAVGLFFTKSSILWATDTPETPSPLYQWNRSTGLTTQLLPPRLLGPWLYTVQGRGAFADFSFIGSRPQEGYLGDEFVHVLTSVDGNHWANRTTVFMRSRAALKKDNKAGPIAITQPDAQGRFWVYFVNLERSQANTTNAEFQLGT